MLHPTTPLFADDGETRNRYEENTFIFSPITLEDIAKEHSEETFDKVFRRKEGDPKPQKLIRSKQII